MSGLPRLSNAESTSANAAPMFPGSYYMSTNLASFGTSKIGSDVANRLHFVPFLIGRACTLDRIGIDVTANGNAGSVIRLGIWRDDGYGRPGALILDAGTIAADAATGTGPEITISQPMPRGLCWLGAVAQSSATTRPTVRTYQEAINFNVAPFVPGSATSRVGYFQDSISGALSDATITMANTVAVYAAPCIYIRAS